MISRLHNLIEHVRHEVRLPDIVGERCVHALVENASCRACIEACPQRAWILNDDSLGLDTEACDGCGLCAPVCPQGAITNYNHSIVIKERRNQLLAFCACERIAPISNEGVLPCIHSLGLQDILRLLQKGVRRLVVATADCNKCERGGKNRLNDRVTSLNDALQKTHSETIKLSWLSLDAWQRLLNKETVSPSGIRVNRRGFFRTLASASFEHGMKPVDPSLSEDVFFVPPGRLIPNPSPQTRWPFLPIIDAGRCNGCDACVKLCPHDAIVLDETDAGSCYRLEPTRCSGCSICSDVCEQAAVSVRQWEMQEQYEVGLKGFRCTACGTTFHVPDDHTLAENALCRICLENNHYKNLHQVLN